MNNTVMNGTTAQEVLAGLRKPVVDQPVDAKPVVAKPAAGPSRAAMRSVQADLQSASDAKLAEVIAMVDALVERGEADRLVAPLRPRLATLRPPRPLRFARLLFLPLDPMIVETPRWRVDAPGVPRGAILPIADAVRQALGDGGRDIDVMIAGHSTADTEMITLAGGMLWPLAARALPGLAMPARWAESGLPASVFGAIAATTAALLRPAPRVAVLRENAGRGLGLDLALLGEILAETAAHGPAAWHAVTTLLLLQLPEPGEVLRAMLATARKGDPALRIATEHAADAALARVAEMAGSGTLLQGDAGAHAGAALAELGRVEELLAQLEENGAGPERRQAIGAARGQIGQACQDWMSRQLQDVLAPALDTAAGAGPAAAEPADAAMETLEHTARGLRALEAMGRRFGGGEPYERMLRAAGDDVARRPVGTGLAAADRARLVELLAGPDAALELLRREALQVST